MLTVRFGGGKMALLEVSNLTKQFGGLTAVSDVTCYLERGEILGLIGPNGAGKTTLFTLRLRRTVTGIMLLTISVSANTRFPKFSKAAGRR